MISFKLGVSVRHAPALEFVISEHVSGALFYSLIVPCYFPVRFLVRVRRYSRLSQPEVAPRLAAWSVLAIRTQRPV